MSLDNIKDMTATARDNLVNAIRTKGISIAEDSTLNQCANAVLMISGGSGICKYYKCASVDTENNTWSGYELVYNEAGYYELSDVITEDLTYSGMTPVVDSIYNEDATLKIERYSKNPDLIPEEGLVFYASLNGDTPNVAETGQVLTEVSQDSNRSQIHYGVEDGIPCAIFADAYVYDSCYVGLTFDASTLPQGAEPRTLSMWVKIYNNSPHAFFAYGEYSSGKTFQLQYSTKYKTINFSCHGDDVYSANSFDFSDRLHHVAVVLDGNTNHDITMYFDGVQQELTVVGDRSVNTSGNICNIGCGGTPSYIRFDGWLSSIRVYDRVLGEEEIAALANEFTPTTA